MNSQSHICIATNHPKEEFPPEGIKNFTKCAGARKLRPCFLFYREHPKVCVNLQTDVR